MSKRTAWILAAITFLTYAPSLGNGFVTYDDDLLVYDNPNVLEFSPRTVAKVFSTYDPELYVPVALLSYQIERFIFGLTPFIFHLTNLLLHIGSALLVYLIALRLSSSRLDDSNAFRVAFASSVIFALHPINSEAVSWIAARKDILSGFLFFASFALYLKHSGSGSRRNYIFSLTAFALALGAKVSVILLPVILLLADWFERRPPTKKNLKEKIPFFALSLIFGVIALFGKRMQIAGLAFTENFLLASKGSVFYIWKLVWPANLSVFHPQNLPIKILSPDILLSLLVLLALLALSVWFYKKRSIFTFCVAFFVLMLVPTFATFWKNGFIYFASERYAYTAVFGIIFFASHVFVPLISDFLIRKPGFIPAAKLAAIIIGLNLALVSASHADTFSDGETLLLHALKINPGSAHALNNLGTTLYKEERYEEALEAYGKAVEIDPRLPQVHTNIALVLIKQNKITDAEGALRRAIEMAPLNRPLLEDELQCYFILSQIMQDRGKLSEALRLLENAASAGPGYFTLHYNMGIKYQEMKNADGAYEQFKKAVQIDRGNTDAYYRLAASAAELGRLEEAIAALRRVIKLDPNYAKAKEHLENLEGMI